MFEFISEKLWFWLAITFIGMGLTVGAFMLIIKKEFGETAEKLLIVPPVLLIIISFILFIIAVLCRAWG